MEDEEDDEDEEPVTKYSVILEEEDYEDEDEIPDSYEKGLQDNFGTDQDEDATGPEIEGWDPRESFNFFRIIY